MNAKTHPHIVCFESVGHYPERFVRVNDEELSVLKQLRHDQGDNLGCDERVAKIIVDDSRNVHFESFNEYC